MKLEYVINRNDKYQNIRQILKEQFHLSDRLIIKLKKLDKILINNISSSIGSTFIEGDCISVDLDFIETSETIASTKMKLSILYEDDAMIIIDKPAGIPVHPSMDHYTDSLSNGVKHYFETIGLQRKIRPVNRLDKNTSGIVIFAKNEYIQESLIYQMKENIFKKEYLALLEGNLETISGTINVPISRKQNSIIERETSPEGVNAITHYELIKNYKGYCLVKFFLKTGRTHQIRVHSQFIEHPILGDSLYGESSKLINRQALHAYKINFIHPISKKKIEIVAKLPKDMKELL